MGDADAALASCGATVAAHVITVYNWAKKFNLFAAVVTAVAPPAGAVFAAAEGAVLATAVVAVATYAVYDCVSQNS